MKNQKSLALFTAALLAPLSCLADTFDTMGIREAWKTTQGSPGMIVATLNTGVNYHLPELREKIAKDAQGNFGYDAIRDVLDPMEGFPGGVGTAEAALIAGANYGVAPGSKVLPVRVFDENGVSNQAVISKGIFYSLNHGAKIIMVDGGPFNESPAICGALQAANSKDVLVVLPAGNSRQELREYPEACALPNILTVTATDQKGALTPYANFGFLGVSLAAIGTDVEAPARDGAVKKFSGTAAAATIAAGVAALVWSAHPEYSAQQVKFAMIRGSIPNESLRGNVMSNGLLNAAKALSADPNARME